jgi:hypothetical protein
MIKNKELALKLLKDKVNGHIEITYTTIISKTGFSKSQLIRWAKQIENKDIETIITHGNKGRQPSLTASTSEVQFICDFKSQYPIITIAQFMDIYHEDIIDNLKHQSIVKLYHLKKRSYSFFHTLFKKQLWISPIKRRKQKGFGREHLLRSPSPRRGMLIQLDGTPFDWFQDGRMFTLHLAVDDATTEVLSGWFTENECQSGYCHVMKLLLQKYGIPLAIYSDKHSIFKNHHKNENLTQFGMMMDDLGIELIFANTSQAKGRVERYNQTVQSRLPNDITRFNIQDYNQLNTWFNDFYIPYINTKFSYHPLDPINEFVEIDKTFDYSTIFCLRETRLIKGYMFSLFNHYYIPIDDNGELLKLLNKSKVDIRIDVFSNEVFLMRFNQKFLCLKLDYIKNRNINTVSNQKDLDLFLKNLFSL